MRQIPLSLKLMFAVFLPLFPACAGQGQKPVPRPEPPELERIIGNQLSSSIRIAWKSSEPQSTNLFIYSTAAPRVDEKLMRRVAEKFSVTGEISPIPADKDGEIGFWIRETNPTNSAKSRCVSFSLVSGSFAYSSGDDGYRWDIKNHKPLMRGVPDKEEAKRMALELLPLLGLSTNDLEHYSNGRIRWASSAPEIGYTDRADKQRKKAVIARNVNFFQRVPGGGVTAGVGNAGQLRFSFVSEGKVASIEWFFRKLVTAGQAKPKTSKEIKRDIRSRNAWTWRQTVPSSLTVTDCALAYPQGNSWLDQKFVWPFYMVTGTNSEGIGMTLFVPLEW
jgi:hypothetical protein